jgi:tetratricopeptide (TPR) repeat protein
MTKCPPSIRLWVVLGTVVLACGFASTPIHAQSTEDLKALSKQVEQLYQEGKYKEATALANRALALAEQLHGADHPNVGDTLSDLALLYNAQSLYDLVEPLWPRSLAIPKMHLVWIAWK